jgi:hypothetical protein
MTEHYHCDFDETVNAELQYKLVIEYWEDLNNCKEKHNSLHLPLRNLKEEIKIINSEYLKKGLLKCSLLNPNELY